MSYMNKYIKPLILVVAFLILSLVTVSSYAYFSATVQGNDNAYDTVITSGEMALMLNDGEQISLNNAIPGDSITKEFSVKNTGTVETTYDVYFSELFNTFEDKNDLVYTLESSNGCTDGNEKVVPRKSSDDSKMVSSCLINPNQTHNYTLTITFKNDGTNQDDNKGKKFSSKISINEYKEYQSEGYLAKGPDFYTKLWSNIAGDKSNIKRIVNSDAAPTESDNYKIVNDTESSYRQDYPIYMWYEDGTVYMYSDNSKVYLNENSEVLFGGLTQAQSIDLSKFNTSRVQRMDQMFLEDNSLVSLDLSKFDTSNVTNMYKMFYENSSLLSINFGNFNTSKVTNMAQMFFECNQIRELNLSSFDTSRVEKMGAMFLQCNKLKNLDLSNFDTSSLTDMSSMLFGASELESVTFGDKFNVSKATGASNMFYNLTSLKKIKFGNNFNINTNSISNMFYNLKNLEEVEFGNNFITSNVKDMSGLFAEDSNLIKVINFNKIDTSNVTNMRGVFSRCEKLNSINMNGINTSNVTNMSSMFQECKSLESLDLSSWDTSNVTDMSHMFDKATNLKTIYTSGDWILNENASSNGMFIYCDSLVGGSGTAYAIEHNDATYARIDDPTNSKPGYFTLKTN